VVDANHQGGATGTLTITGMVSLAVADATVVEGDAGTVTATLTAVLSGPSPSTVTVDWTTVDGTATAGSDHLAASGTLTFAPGVTSQPISIPIIGDTILEGDEYLDIHLGNPQQVLLTTTSARLAISDNEGNTPPTIAEGATASVTCDEDASPVPFALTLHASDGDAGQTLTWTLATPPAHGSVSIPAGGASQVIAYVPAADFHGSDAFTLQVDDGHGGSATIAVSVTVTARNDAPVNTTPPLVTITGTTATASTGDWNDARDLAPGAITYAIQWQRADDAAGAGAADLAGETGSTHTLTAADVGKFLRVVVTASDDGEGLPARASTSVSSALVAVPTPGGSSSGNAGAGGGGGGGCGLGGGSSVLLGLAMLLGFAVFLRRLR
jgi:hypothetical protein